MDSVLDALAGGNKIAAVKHYMTYKGCSLRESKVFVESLIEELGGPSMGGSSKSGCALIFLLSLIGPASVGIVWICRQA